jgi:hypothetical protein
VGYRRQRPSPGPWSARRLGFAKGARLETRLVGLQAGAAYEVNLSTAASGGGWPAVASDPVTFQTAAAGARYLPVYRVSEEGFSSTVDYLQNHNSADLGGQNAFITAFDGEVGHWFTLNTTDVVEYCIELADAPFADYLSCNTNFGGHSTNGSASARSTCGCMNGGDRVICHQDNRTAVEACGVSDIARHRAEADANHSRTHYQCTNFTNASACVTAAGRGLVHYGNCSWIGQNHTCAVSVPSRGG